MMTYMPSEVSNEAHFHRVGEFAEKLGGKNYAFLAKNVMLYRDQDGEYVIFTIHPKAKYRAKDYMKLPEGAPYELLNGKLIFMPSPKDFHQDVSMKLSSALYFFVSKNKLGIVRTAPLDVHLSKYSVVQPDILFLSNERMERKKEYIYGAPDLVVEILSKGTEKKDKKTKYKLYEKHGVLEYWLVDLEALTVQIYISKNGKFVPKNILNMGDLLVSEIVPGFEMPLSEIFEDAGR